MHETVETGRSALGSVQTPESKVHGGAHGASVLKKRKCIEGSGECLVRLGLYRPFGQLSEEAKRAGAAVSDESSLARVLGGLLTGWRLPSFVNCVREGMCVEKTRVFERYMRMVSLNAYFRNARTF